jgi:tetratricopeptide (TPR) repeat protein
MVSLPAEDDVRLVGTLERQFYLGRCTAFLPARYGILHEKALREELATVPERDRLRRARLLRLLGETGTAARELTAVLRRRNAPATAHALHWESGAGGAAAIDRAVALEPGNGTWRAWRAIERLSRAEHDRAAEDAATATELLLGQAFPHFVSALISHAQNRPGSVLRSLDHALRMEPSVEWGYRLRAINHLKSGDREGCLQDAFKAMTLNEMAGTLFIPLGIYQDRLNAREHVAAASRFIAREPKAHWAYVYRSDWKRGPEINENSSARDDLLKALELAPDCAWAWAYLTRCQTAMGDFSGAKKSIERAVALAPNCGWIWAWRGEQLRRSGDIAAASSAFDRAVRLSPDYELTYAWRGAVRRSLARSAEAVEDLSIALRLEPTTAAWCRHERMNAYRNLGHFPEALKDLDVAWRTNPKFVWENEPKRFAAAFAQLESVVKTDPANVPALSWQGDLLMRQRDFSAALALLTRAVKVDARALNARLLRGRVLGELGRWSKAFSDFDVAVRLEPEFPFARAWRGRARMVKGDLKGATADFRAALRREHNSAWILAWKGEAEFRLGRFRHAETDLSKALEVHVRYGDAHLWRGAARSRMGDALGGEADLSEALRLQPELPLALFYRGLLRSGTGRVAEARADLTAALASRALKLPEASEARRALARLQEQASAPPNPEAEAERLVNEGRHGAAADIYTRLLAQGRQKTKYLIRRAEAYRCMGRHDLSLKDRLAVTALEPGKPGPLAQQGEIRRRLGDIQGALKDARRALTLDARCATAWVLRSECERGLGRFADAVRSAGRAAQADPGWGWAHVVRAKALRQSGDLDAALAETAVAEGLDDPAYAWAWRGEILRRAGRLSSALESLNKASALQPANAWILALKGETRRELGDPAGGLADIQEAMRLDIRCSCAYDFLGAEPRAVRRDASLAWVYAWRGGIHRGAGRLRQARADLSRAVRLDPRSFWIVAWRGELRLHEGDAAGALKDLSKATKIFPRYPQGLIWQGQAHLKVGTAKLAQRDFSAALALDPNNVWAMIGRAACHESLGQEAAAQDLLARARQIAPALFA